MNFEIPKLESKKEALDDAWYKRFEKFASFQAYEYLTGDVKYRNQQKKLFLEDKIDNPELDYPKLKTLDIEHIDQALLELKRDILSQEQNAIVKQAYHWRINEKLAEIRMLKSAKAGEDHRFSKYSNFIYGKPEKNIHNYTLLRIQPEIEKQLSSSDEDIRKAAERLNSELFSETGNLHSTLDFESLNIPNVKNIKEGQVLKSEEIRQAFEKALEKYRISGWSILVEETTATAISVSQEKKSITIPENKTLFEKELEPIIAHEIGTHALRRESGERTKLHLLGLGLDRFLKGEEGIATYEEQKILGDDDFANLMGHLRTSLAFGVDGKKRNFRQIFEIIRDYKFITSKKEKDKAWAAAQDNAWTTSVRVFRGTSCKTPGACFTQDIVYREGNIGIWNVLKTNPEEERRFSVGKYDPANPRHIWILEQLGITDADLANLDKEPKIE